MMYSQKVMEHFKHPHNLKEIKNPDGIGKIGNPVCLIPSTKIHINNNLKEIEKIDLNDKVLNHDGKYSKVTKIYKRNYSGKIIEIKNKLGKTILTPEHEVLSVKVPKTDHFARFKNKKKLKVYWYHAEELEKGDLIVYPILKEEKDLEFIEFPQLKKKFDFRSKNIPKKIKVNEDFLRLAGYYLAEGSLKDKVTKTYLSFTFNINEEDLAQDVVDIAKRLFGINPFKKIKKERNTLVVTINNVFIVRLFKLLFGAGADNKKIPDWMMLLPIEKQKSLIYGLWKGDGYFNEKKRAGYSTISYVLCQQLKILLLRQKIVPSIYTEEEKITKGVKHKKAYRIHIGDRNSLERLAEVLSLKLKIDKPVSIDSWFDNNYLFVPITNINKIGYSGLVHNLEVENSMSYTTESLAVHNCGDLMWVYIKVGKNKEGKEYIKDIGVKTFGCVAAIATSSMITELANGKTLEEAKKITRDDIKDALDGLPPIKVHCSNLSADGLHKAIEDYESKKKVQK